MPRRVEPPLRHWDRAETRRELVSRTSGVDLAVGDVRVRASAVPLFRTGDGGGLEQAIRLAVETPEPRDGLTVSVLAGERVLDKIALDLAEDETTAHVFVPEVDGAARFTVTAELPGAERASAEITVEPQRKWSIFLVHHSHFDYGYTDPQAVVMEQQLQYLDAVLELAAATDGWADDAAFRWNVEVTYPLKQWLANRPKATRDEFVARVKEGRIEVNALPFSMHTEVYSIDELAWGLKFADELRERYGIEIVSAIQSDVPGHTIGLLNLLTAAKIKYFSVAHNYAGRSVPYLAGGQDLTRPFYWKAANDERLLVWQTDTPHGVAYMDGVLVGLAEREELARTLLPEYLLALAERPYPYGKHAFGWHDLPPDLPVTKKPYPYDVLHFRVQNTMADNSSPSLAVSETVRDWNERWAFPRLRLATNRSFFETIEGRYGDRFATFEGDWTDWWVDGVGSDARPLGINRRAQGTVRAAQTLHALADRLTDDAAPEVASEIDRTYEDLALFDEHTWGAANPWNERLEKMDSGALQWDRKAAFAHIGAARADVLLDSGKRRFAEAFRSGPEALASVVVFNPSGFARTDHVRLLLPAERAALGQAITVVDAATGEPVPHALEAQDWPSFRAKGRWLTFLAKDIPAVGYARYDIAAAKDASATPEVSSDPFRLESAAYRVTVDPQQGFVASIVDRETGRELVDAEAPFGFNEYIYDTYTTAPAYNHLSGRVQAVDFSLFGSRVTAGQASVVARTSDAIAERLTLRLVAEGAKWLETTISLPHGVKRVDLSNRLHKTSTLVKESVHFAFPFGVDDPDPEYEISGGVTSQAAPHIPGSARHMFAIRHWLALKDGQGSAAWATLEAPLIALGNIALPYLPFPETIPAANARPSTVYSWALNNLWDTNFPPSQGGEMLFRYAVASDAGQGSRELGIRTGAALAEPLVGVVVPARRGELGRSLPAQGSFVTVSDPLVEVVSLAPAREGDGLVAFLHSLAPETTTVEVATPGLPVRGLSLGSFLERDYREVSLRDGAGQVTIAPGEYVAVRLELGAGSNT